LYREKDVVGVFFSFIFPVLSNPKTLMLNNVERAKT